MDVEDAVESSLAVLAAEAELAVERVASNGGPMGTSRLMGKFSFCNLRISRQFTFR